MRAELAHTLAEQKAPARVLSGPASRTVESIDEDAGAVRRWRLEGGPVS